MIESNISGDKFPVNNTRVSLSMRYFIYFR